MELIVILLYIVYLGFSLVLYSHPSDVGISVSLDIS